MRLSAASDYSMTELANLWARSYADYFVPIGDDPDQLRRHIEQNDVDLARSLVAHEGDRFVGMSLLGVRGDRGWIGGFGIAAESRRRGLSRQLIDAQLDTARGGGIGAIQLEVLEQNWAAKVYGAAGFATRRRLLSLRATMPISHAPPPAQAQDSQVLLDAVARMRGAVRMGWQREPASVSHALARGARGFLSSDGASAVVLSAQGLRVLDAAGDPNALVALLAQLAAGETVTVPNEPEDGPLAKALLACGFERVWTQFEMSTTR